MLFYDYGGHVCPYVSFFLSVLGVMHPLSTCYMYEFVVVLPQHTIFYKLY